ncbi:carbohydrate porin [Silvibacterium acidisoli]|uniref:carbohydrate porin n=1 Tax=Acidobacteriaceae bacterium ZG23-2 TaxID=2883246 RepID=UPI00406BF64F
MVRRISVILSLLLSLPGAQALSTRDLPDAPTAPEAAAEADEHPLLSAFLPPQSEGSSSSGISQEERGSDENVVTVFPHPDHTWWYFAGQANSILQAHPAFHSPYEGTNSFQARGEHKISFVGTFYTGFQLHPNQRYNTDLIFDVESAGGRGLSQALGIAGFTNVDVVRNPNLGSAPYIARVQFHQTIGLTNEMTDAGRGPFSLATKVPVRRLEFRFGKMSLPDVFDINSIGSDSHLQFTNWSIVNNGAWDYAADTRGYTFAGIAEYDDRIWSFRYGLAAMPTVANGIDLDWAISRAHGQNFEFELRKSLLPGRHGTIRLLAFDNKAHMGIYRDAVNDFLTGVTPTPQIAARAPIGTTKYGFGWNNEQEINDHLRVFSRFGWNEGQHESFAYTEIDQTVLFGADYNGAQWKRPVDKIGAAFVSNAIKKDHQNYLADGGLGFILGDGKLNYGRENIEEFYYNTHIHNGLFAALQLSHIDNPGYNRDRGAVWVPGVRLHVDF